MLIFNRSDKDKEVWVNVSNRTVVRVLVIVICAFILLLAVKRAAHAIELILAALSLSLALNGPVHWVAKHIPGRKNGSRAIATAVSVLIVVILLGTFIALITTPLTKQTDKFIKAVPTLVKEVRQQNSSLGKIVRKYNLEGEVNSLSKQLSSHLHNVTGSALSLAGSFASSVFSVLVILVLTFMMLVEGQRWQKRFEELIPSEHRAHIDLVARDMYKVIRGYVNGQVLLALIATVLITPMLLILHISYPFALMVVVFICGLIPLVGHTIGAILITIVALFHSTLAAVIILAYYILYQQVENYVVQPRIQSNATNLSPLMVIIAILVGVSFGGLLGGLIAIPVAGCLRVLVVDLLHSHGKLQGTSSTTRS